MYFYNFDNISYKKKKEGLHVKVITGENIQVGFGKLDPGFASEHSHPNEQLGRVISGRVEMIIDGEKKVCSSGDIYHIPGSVHHSSRVLSSHPAEIMDIFSPPKQENIIT